jgi:5-deoxy-glucuronate isomerase
MKIVARAESQSEARVSETEARVSETEARVIQAETGVIQAETGVFQAAPPNHLAPDELRLRPGPDGVTVSVDPARAGWRYLSFEVRRLAGGTSLSFGSDVAETAIVLLAGSDLAVDGLGTLRGRPSPFDGLPSALYLPTATSAMVRAFRDTDIAIARAPASGRGDASVEPILIGPDDVAVEIRGAGSATRQINHIIKPEFAADRLLLVEVLTPSGNWSSWPPHKHDVDEMPTEAVLEEVYCYRFRRPEAWGMQRVYRRPGTPAAEASGPRDAVFAVRHGEVVLVTDGYHPFVATHGDDAYYLNALAGDRRTMACSFDPDLDGVRETWTSMQGDPRVPFVSR